MQYTGWLREGQERLQKKKGIFQVETDEKRKREYARQGRADKDLCMGDIRVQSRQAHGEGTVH